MQKFIHILIFSLLLFSCKGQEKHNKLSPNPTNRMNADTVDLTSDIFLFQVNESLENHKRHKWELYIKNKKENNRILLDSLLITHPGPNDIVIDESSILEIPQLLSGFIDNDKIYIFLFKERALWLYKYIFTEREFKFTRIKVFDMFPGSVANFGGAYFEVRPYTIGTENYFYIRHNRVIGRIEMIARLDKNRFVLKKISFSEKQDVIQVRSVSDFGKGYYQQIKEEISAYKLRDNDTQKLQPTKPTKEEYGFIERIRDKINKEYFYIKKSGKENSERQFLEEHTLFFANDGKTLDGSQIENVDKYIKEVLYFNNGNTNEIQTIGYIYANFQEEYLCFFYEENTSLKVIKYNIYDSEWLIGDYKEEEISGLINNDLFKYRSRD